jgi:hypothetical protein
MTATVSRETLGCARSHAREVGAVLGGSVIRGGFVLCVSEGCEATKVRTKFVRASFK